MNYGNDFKSFRKSFNLSQEQLAKKTGISQQAISFCEQNKRKPNMDDCIILADFYGISLDELVGRDIPKHAINIDQRHNNGTINNKF